MIESQSFHYACCFECLVLVSLLLKMFHVSELVTTNVLCFASLKAKALVFAPRTELSGDGSTLLDAAEVPDRITAFMFVFAVYYIVLFCFVSYVRIYYVLK